MHDTANRMRRLQLNFTENFPPIKRIRWFNLVILLITPALGLYGLLTIPLYSKTLAFSVLCYIISMLGEHTLDSNCRPLSFKLYSSGNNFRHHSRYLCNTNPHTQPLPHSTLSQVTIVCGLTGHTRHHSHCRLLCSRPARVQSKVPASGGLVDTVRTTATRTQIRTLTIPNEAYSGPTSAGLSSSLNPVPAAPTYLTSRMIHSSSGNTAGTFPCCLSLVSPFPLPSLVSCGETGREVFILRVHFV